MKGFRRIIFWGHLVVGIVAGLVILSMAVTGCLMSFEKQLIAFAERGHAVTPPAGVERLGPESLVTKLKETNPEIQPAGLLMRADVSLPVVVNAGRDKTVLMNPYSGAVLGDGHWLRGTLHSVEHFHRELGLSQTGKKIVGASCLCFGVLLVSGIYLWWPRHWSANALRGSLRFDTRLRGKARDWNWHNVIGFWSAFPLLLIIVTGLIMNYPWANNLLFRLTGNEPPAPRQPPVAALAGGAKGGKEGGEGKRPYGQGKGEGKRGGSGGPGGPGGEPKVAGLDKLWPTVLAQADGWQTINLRLPTSATAPVIFMIDRGNGGRPDKKSQLTLNRQSGEVEKVEDYASYNLGRQLRMWARFTHTGEAGGLVGQGIAAVSTMAAMLLVWTGFALAWRRFFGRKPDASEGAAAVAVERVAEEKAVAMEVGA